MPLNNKRAFISEITPLTAFFLLVSSSGCMTLPPGQESIDTKLDKKAIVGALQKGGYVIYFRHAATDRSQADSDRLNLSDCATQRNLSEQGKEQSRAVGKAFSALDIKVATVITSPFCRCIDMGNLAFGAVTISEDLLFAISKDEKETKRLAAALRKLLGTKPPDGSNTVLISHSVNLKEATGILPQSEGEADFFEPHGDSRFSHIGRALPEEWVELVKLK